VGDVQGVHLMLRVLPAYGCLLTLRVVLGATCSDGWHARRCACS
jgi:hypothetical protein